MQLNGQLIRDASTAKQLWIWTGFSFLLCLLIIERVVTIVQFNTVLEQDMLCPHPIKIAATQNILPDPIASLPWIAQNSSEVVTSKVVLPKMMVFSVIQSNLAEQSTVLLSMENAPAQWVRIGDKIAPNARIVRIQANVIDVLYQGQIFQLPLYLRNDKIWTLGSSNFERSYRRFLRVQI